jgi:hypothetical protein
MPSGLKTTIVLSASLAGMLNLWQFDGTANRQAQVAFVPAWQSGFKATPAPAAVARPISTPSPVVHSQGSSQLPSTLAPDPSGLIKTQLIRARLNPEFADLYLATQNSTHTPWQLLAAVHQTETGQSGSTTRRSTAGATGPMQFMPATFARYAEDGNSDGIKDVTNVSDAVMSAGNYLRASGADQGHYTAALYNYNHSGAYVSHVMTIAHTLGL